MWKKNHIFFNINVSLNTESCIWNNPKLKIGKQPFLWKDWVARGIIKLGDLYDGNSLKSFENLAAEHNLQQAHFWKHLQLRNVLTQALGKNYSPQYSTLLSDILKKMGLGHEAFVTII